MIEHTLIKIYLHLYFILMNSHIYLIKDTAMRKSLLHSNEKSDIISLISKEIKVDIPFKF